MAKRGGTRRKEEREHCKASRVGGGKGEGGKGKGGKDTRLRKRTMEKIEGKLLRSEDGGGRRRLQESPPRKGTIGRRKKKVIEQRRRRRRRRREAMMSAQGSVRGAVGEVKNDPKVLKAYVRFPCARGEKLPRGVKSK